MSGYFPLGYQIGPDFAKSNKKLHHVCTNWRSGLASQGSKTTAALLKRKNQLTGIFLHSLVMLLN